MRKIFETDTVSPICRYIPRSPTTMMHQIVWRSHHGTLTIMRYISHSAHSGNAIALLGQHLAVNRDIFLEP